MAGPDVFVAVFSLRLAHISLHQIPQHLALGREQRDAGADVLLVSGPTALPKPTGIALSQVTSTEEMRAAVLEHQPAQDALVFAAAVSDYRVRNPAEHKIKRAEASELNVRLEQNPDIVATVSGDFVKVAFAAETEGLLENARRKLEQKGAHLIVANDVTAPDAGFAVDTNRVTILDRDGGAEELPLLSKYDVASRVLDRVVSLLRR